MGIRKDIIAGISCFNDIFCFNFVPGFFPEVITSFFKKDSMLDWAFFSAVSRCRVKPESKAYTSLNGTE
jgi:hypothetical protein